MIVLLLNRSDSRSHVCCRASLKADPFIFNSQNRNTALRHFASDFKNHSPVGMWKTANYFSHTQTCTCTDKKRLRPFTLNTWKEIYIFLKITKQNDISYRRAAAAIRRGNLHRTPNENTLPEEEQHHWTWLIFFQSFLPTYLHTKFCSGWECCPTSGKSIKRLCHIMSFF